MKGNQKANEKGSLPTDLSNHGVLGSEDSRFVAGNMTSDKNFLACRW